jgi:hypothetical protein
MGSFGYVLARFWALPVLSYRRLKRRLAHILATIASERVIASEARDALRRSAMELQHMADDALPQWYALALHKKGEQPGEAVRHLQALINCQSPDAIEHRIASVQASLGLSLPARPPEN